MPADLHCHSVISDGTANISDIINMAKRIGLGSVAITDHDDLSAHLYPEAKNFPIIKGVEISSRDAGTGRRVHILCYLPKNESALESILKETRKKRRNELQKSMEIISKYYPVSFDMIEKRRKNFEGFFKQHVMQLFMELGYCRTIFGEFYSTLFSKQNGIAPTNVIYPNVYDVLEAIQSARGVAVMAHPTVYNSIDLLKALCKNKLIDGIEIDHPKQGPEERKFLSELASQYGLLKTGGTDFHGYNTSDPHPLGSCTTSDEQLNKLFEISNSK